MTLQDDEGTRAALRGEFLRLFHALSSPYRYSSAKYLPLIREKWPDIRLLLEGHEVRAVGSYFEIHLAEPCQLSCGYCRGELRDVPKGQAMMNSDQALRLIDEIAALNPRAFLRFSGVIGEPLLHRHAADVFARANAHSLRCGLTTNGLLLNKPGLAPQLLHAEFVHVSLDAGCDATYRHLKKGQAGDFHRVVANLGELARLRTAAASHVRLVTSVVLQSENYREIPILSPLLKETGVDVLEVKMMHFDPRRGMAAEEVHDAYRLLAEVRLSDEDAAFRIVEVQTEEEALAKLYPDPRSVDFPTCFAGRLGLNTTISPRSEVQSCCQYYQPTLGVIGRLEDGFASVWTSQQREAVLSGDPRTKCVNCSPSDQFINQFVDFLRRAHKQDSLFLDWVEVEILPHHQEPAPRGLT